jgi:hypothetical protein
MIVTCSSNVGAQNNVTYTFTFSTGYTVPATGSLSILFPSITDSFLALGATCQLSTNFASSAYCAITVAQRVDIFLGGGAPLNSQKSYTLTVFGLNTPNIENTGALYFTITSYFSSNLQLQEIICAANFSYPSLTPSPVTQCVFSVLA